MYYIIVDEEEVFYPGPDNGCLTFDTIEEAKSWLWANEKNAAILMDLDTDHPAVSIVYLFMIKPLIEESHIVLLAESKGIKPNTYYSVCQECGSINVQVRCWVDFNNQKILDHEDIGTGDCWCEQCEEHTDIKFF